MFTSDDFDPAAHVAAAARAVGLVLTAGEQAAVAAELAQIATIARPALVLDLPPLTQPAPVFQP